jgi:CHAT domain-containing protein
VDGQSAARKSEVASPTPRTPKDITKEIIEKIVRGEFVAALKESDDSAKEFQARDPYWAWQFQILGARAQTYLGEYNDAIRRLSAPLPPVLAKTDVAVLRLMCRATAEDLAQKSSAAEADLLAAERLSAAASPSIRMQVLQARGNLDSSKKKYDAAERSFRKALDISRAQNSPSSEVSILGSLGYVAMGRQHLDEATDRFRASLVLAKSIGADSTVSTTLGNIAWNYDALGDFENARESFRQAVDAAQRSGEKTKQVIWLSNLALVDGEIRSYPEAEKIALQARELAQALQDPLTTVTALNASTQIALETGQFPMAVEFNRLASAIEVAGFDHDAVVSTELDAGRIAEQSGRLTQAEQIFDKIRVDPRVDTPALWESQALLASVYLKENRSADSELAFRRCLQTVQNAWNSVGETSRISFLSGVITFYGEYIDFLIARGRVAEALRIAETSRARTLTTGLSASGKVPEASFSDIELRKLSKRLKSTLLCYWIGQKHSHLWVVTPEKFSYFPIAGAQELDEALVNYRELLVNSGDALDPLSADGEKLFAALVAPAKALIPDGSRITILPDANLYGLNFETLIAPSPRPHYWIEDVSISTASSLTLLAASAGRPAPTPKNLLLIGDPAEVSSEFRKLPQAADEMQRVAHYFPSSNRESIQGPLATPAAYLKARPERFSYLHFVTHGTASLTHPMDSAVILSRPAPNEGYKLYARDIVAHPLHATLVTISACNGAGTRAYSGEGLVGLSWAFLRAGAHNVIGALWEVDDRSTPQLMDSLYDGLTTGQEPATALRNAKLAFVHSGTVYNKPFYWAPFQLYAGS